jgi:hypothetical protein
MTYDSVSLLQARRSWLPAISNTRLKDLVCVGKMIPHGDRRDRAKSRGAEDESAPAEPRDDRIVREFVLNDHINDYGRMQARLLPTPLQNIGQGFQADQLRR